MTEKEMERNQPFFYWLCSVSGIGDLTIAKLLKQACPEEIFYADEKTLSGWNEEKILGESQLRNLKKARKTWNLYTEYEKLGKSGISIYPVYHSGYPQKLLHIPGCPAALFVKGSLPKEKAPSLAIIGARDCSGYGKRVAEEFSGYLGGQGVQIISGMARGVDGISQRAALLSGGSSFGVLGCGVDICYPSQNRLLYEELCKRGGVLSSYVPGTEPKSAHFPPRNRIISGLSDAILVVEAREKSGTLITVDMALEQGREVYALPGRVGDILSEGCNRLIAQGAGIAVSPKALLEEIWNLKEKQSVCVEKISCKKQEQKEELCEKLDKEERAFYRSLEDEPRTVEELLGEARQYLKASIDMPTAYEILFRLSMKGMAEQVGGGYYYVRARTSHF